MNKKNKDKIINWVGLITNLAIMISLGMVLLKLFTD